MTTFLKKPSRMRKRPLLASFTLACAVSSCGINGSYRLIGPANMVGKKKINARNFGKEWEVMRPCLVSIQ